MRHKQTYDTRWGKVPGPNRSLPVDPFEFVNLFHAVAAQFSEMLKYL